MSYNFCFSVSKEFPVRAKVHVIFEQPSYDKKKFANVVTSDETWVHYFEPVRKVSKNYGPPKTVKDQ